MIGKIIKIENNFSKVIDFKGKVYRCSIKGNIKKQIVPIVGDNVKIELIDNDNANIVEIMERKNTIYRPRISNVDQVVVVTSLFKPLFSSYILNKYILLSEIKNIKPILLFTKIDLLKKTKEFDEIMIKINEYKKFDYEVLIVDNKNDNKNSNDLNKLKNLMKNQVSYFTGQTGAGKSSTLNHFIDDYKIKTNEISEKLNRGKHTTTYVSIYYLDSNILIADTPGFSSFELKDFKAEEVAKEFGFFKKYTKECKFSNCLHIYEKICGIKNALHYKKIPEFIYNDYIKMIEEIQKRKNKY